MDGSRKTGGPWRQQWWAPDGSNVHATSRSGTCVVSAVGIYDMLRVELAPNGAFNVTEFGTVKDPDQFKALYAYSPYHHVAEDTNYPAILFMTGANDGRVAPYHSRTMVARLDEANKSSHPTLLRTSTSSGHGIGTALSERIK